MDSWDVVMEVEKMDISSDRIAGKWMKQLRNFDHTGQVDGILLHEAEKGEIRGICTRHHSFHRAGCLLLHYDLHMNLALDPRCTRRW